MKLKFLLSTAPVILVTVFLITACGDRVGSEAWCDKLDQKPKSEWTLEETGDYTKYCVLGMDPGKWCEKMDEKPKGDWTANEAADYAKNCVGGRNSD